MSGEQTPDVDGADVGPYSDKSVAEIIHDYVVVRGDIVEQYARDQMAHIIEDRITARVTAAVAAERERRNRLGRDRAIALRDRDMAVSRAEAAERKVVAVEALVDDMGHGRIGPVQAYDHLRAALDGPAAQDPK